MYVDLRAACKIRPANICHDGKNSRILAFSNVFANYRWRIPLKGIREYLPRHNYADKNSSRFASVKFDDQHSSRFASVNCYLLKTSE